jgi:hypothetical protein
MTGRKLMFFNSSNTSSCFSTDLCANNPDILAAIGIQEVTAKHVFDQLLVLANTNLSSSVGLEDMCKTPGEILCFLIYPIHHHVSPQICVGKA